MSNRKFNMASSSVIIPSLCLVLSLFTPVENSGVDLGLCHKNSEDCQCGGSTGYQIMIPVKECTFFYRWRPSCKPCDEIDKDVRCAPYAQCQDCDPKIDKCVRCPPTKYGKWCTLECVCKNGGSCDQETGKCTCPPEFQGPTCADSALCPSLPSFSAGLEYSPRQVSYKIGSKLTFNCRSSGEYLEGVPALECLPTGQWSGHPPKCIRECPFVATPADGSVHLPNGRLKVGTTLNYTCNANHRLVGDALRTCQEDGTWTGDDPICEKLITCKDPVVFQFGNVTIIQRSSTELITPGTTVAFACNKGYSLIGEEYSQCTEEGKWSKPTPVCAKEGTVCLSMGEFKHGKYTVKGKGGPQAYFEGAEVEFSCESLHYLYGQKKAVCSANGTWSSEKPICIKLTVCQSLDPLANGKIEIQLMEAMPVGNSAIPGSSRGRTGRMGDGGPRLPTPVRGLSVAARTAMFSTKLPQGYYHMGTRAIFSCESRYYELVGSKLRVCETTGQWSGRQPTCMPVCGRSSGPRIPFITHGNVSHIGQWPWQVAVSYRHDPDDPESDWDIACGASLIAERWVVTAAHCVCYATTVLAVQTDEVQLSLGKYYRDATKDDKDVEIREVEEILVNPDYEPTSFDADIALLRLKDPVKLSSRVQPVCLPEDVDASNERVREGKPGVIIGWGETEKGKLSDVLQQVKVPVVSNKKCEDDYKKSDPTFVITRNMMCAGFEEGKRDSCSGDSGGPLVFPLNEREDRWVLEGIVSWGSKNGCGQSYQYGGYARVQKFISWLHEYI